jgi:UDP-galactopyranose mutase
MTRSWVQRLYPGEIAGYASLLFHRGERPIPYDSAGVVIAGLHLRWRGVWQRPNHLLARIARDVPVVVLEEPYLARRDEDVVAHADGVTVVTPHRRAKPADAVDERALETVRELAAGRAPLVWLYTPMMLRLAEAFPDAPLVFDKMDELAKFAQADPRIAPRECEVLARADVVFSGGRSLHRTVQHRARIARCYPSGVDVEHFERARTAEPHPDLAPYRGGKVYGYVGVIDERVDLALVDALAAAHPSATVAMVGPLAKIEESALPRRRNIAYLGKREYADLPALLAGFDVALMPFALNEHTANISPTKTLEYMAAGLPIVSTPVPDVVEDHADVVHVARDRDEFVALVERAQRPDPLREQRAHEKTRAATWDAIAAAMRADLEAAGISYAAASPARKNSAALV